jgi:transposase
MLTIGIDAHKRVHAAVAIDAAGREQGHWRGGNTPAAWQELRDWARELGAERCWGIEGAGQYGRGLAQTLVVAGEPVVEVNPRLTAGMRRGSRVRGKSDRLDALAVARVVVQEGEALPTVVPDDASAVLAELVADRESARTEATRLELALRQAAETAQAISQVGHPQLAPLRDICGVADLTAGMLAAHLGGRRFASDAALASYAGVTPLEASSGAYTRHRLNRGDNRQLNALFHRIALVQSGSSPEAKAYLARRHREGKTKAEAFRALKRYIARAVFRRWKLCTLPPLEDLRVPLI